MRASYTAWYTFQRELTVSRSRTCTASSLSSEAGLCHTLPFWCCCWWQPDGAGQEEARDCPQELLHCVAGELGKQIRSTVGWIGRLIHVFLIFLSSISWVHESSDQLGA
jgi:hypothetical protein